MTKSTKADGKPKAIEKLHKVIKKLTSTSNVIKKKDYGIIKIIVLSTRLFLN